MKKHPSHLLLWILFGWFALMSAVFIYYQDVDGILLNKPISFEGMDTKAVKTDKDVYHPGDTVHLLFSYCRNRSYTATSQWKLVNSIVTLYAAKTVVTSPMCAKDKFYPVGIIPPDTIPGKHHLEGTTAVQLSLLNTIYYNYRSVDFMVEK